MLYRSRRILALLVLTAGLGTACAGTDVADRDPYPVHPVQGDYDDTPSLARGILVESLRIGERLLFADRIDPDLTRGRGGGVVVDHRGVRELLSGAQLRALSSFDVYAGFGAIAADVDQHNAEAKKSLSITILSFADEATAEQAAAAMAAEDFAANVDNVPVPVPGFPAALSHWRPGISTVGSWMVWKNLVLRVFAKIAEPNEQQLTDVVSRTYTAQLAELGTFTPTPVADLPGLRLDRDALLPRLVKTGDYAPDKQTFAVYGPRAYALLVDHPARQAQEYLAGGIDAVAVSHNKFLYRTAGPDSAAAYAEQTVQRLTAGNYVAMSGPSDAHCFRRLRPSVEAIEARRFTCLIVEGRFVTQIFSNDDPDIRWLAQAQQAVLAESR
ncbi:DUF7373 family lipoprotein [Nocardia lijiangensis]|uniref:DUF7373 family lipoprotein n=1 Tax=Nocardia lijiangensis TaxID=299618 RepID=UPI0008306BDB|nr:hypothetical protein [Nocardia lijiangensis]